MRNMRRICRLINVLSIRTFAHLHICTFALSLNANSLNLRNLLTLLLLITIAWTGAKAQGNLPGIIAGNILDEKGKAVANATVELQPLGDSLKKRSMVSDKDGGFTFSGLGYAYYQKGEYEFALSQLNKAIILDDASKLGYYYKGLCFIATNRKGEAMSMYYKLKELDGDSATELIDKINKMK